MEKIMKKYTPEPWSVETLSVYDPGHQASKELSLVIVNLDDPRNTEDNKHVIAEIAMLKNVDAIDAFNAARIVECVNACAGIKHPKEFIPAIRKEMQDIRDCINADPNESTYDEVARLKHRIIEFNLIKSEIIFLAKKEIGNMLAKGLTYDNAPAYNTLKNIISKYPVNSAHPENAAPPILSGQKMQGTPFNEPLPEYETIPVGVVGKNNEILPFIQPEDMIEGEFYIDEDCIFRFENIVEGSVWVSFISFLKTQRFFKGTFHEKRPLCRKDDLVNVRKALAAEILEYFRNEKGSDHA